MKRERVGLAVTLWFILVAFYAVMPLLIWLQTVSDVPLYLKHTVPPGQLAYLLSRLVGLYALSLISLQIAVGLLLPSSKKIQLHACLGIGSLCAIVLHALLFIYAASMRSGHLKIDLLVPQLNQGYYEMVVSLGVIGLWTAVAVLIAGMLRLSGSRRWRYVHYLSVPTFIALFLHGLLIGTDTRLPLGGIFYCVIALTIGSACLARIQAPPPIE